MKHRRRKGKSKQIRIRRRIHTPSPSSIRIENHGQTTFQNQKGQRVQKAIWWDQKKPEKENQNPSGTAQQARVFAVRLEHDKR